MTTTYVIRTVTSPLGTDACILRVADWANIPADPANTDYQAYLAWVAEGNTAEEWQPDINNGGE